MVGIEFEPFRDKITDFYFRKEWQDNIDNNIFPIGGTRTRPWLDAYFYMRMDIWMEKEYGVNHCRDLGSPKKIYFANEVDATRFVLIWS
jgi:hypothetical protein